MNWHMGNVLPGLYVGNYRDSKDYQQLEKFKISHIIAIHDSPRRLLPDKHYLCVMASDTPDQNLSQYFSVCNDFIHAARLREGNVLIHCLAGMSRSVTVAVAYIMTATHLNWKEALKVVRAGRAVANPNTGFQNQLLEFEQYKLADERRRLRERFPSSALEQLDRIKCGLALDNYQELLQNRDICEGNCSRGEKCPTGDSIPTYAIGGFSITGREASGSGNAQVRQNVAYTLRFIVDKWKNRTFEQLSSEEISVSDLESERETDLDTDHDDSNGISSSSSGEELMPNVVYYNADANVGRFVNNLDENAKEEERHSPYTAHMKRLAKKFEEEQRSATAPRQKAADSASQTPRQTPVKRTPRKPEIKR
ncbi:dual specificity protein phosphatase PHS1-like isoform X3 [Drosophila novamexicana]|uniref:dual specificity protein phosphatase PHS1-like isoform X3 n=1 Tax=Drosophila novamexicana TaxID=47314 RepID=UPI0011E5A2AA|nr:dual specificity protein phosphatase PHS1-like isoform X3 [Drosophila novamexicana]